MDTDIRFLVPDPILDGKERDSLALIQKRYERLSRPGVLQKAGKAASGAIPAPVRRLAKSVGGRISGQKLFEQAMGVLNDGFRQLEEAASKYSLPRADVIRRVNRVSEGREIRELREICLLRGYELSRLVREYKKKDVLFALAAGTATGAVGLWGLPFSLAFSVFTTYRAVQTVAMFYGYDVREDPSEMIIAGDVLVNAVSPSAAAADEIGGTIARFMAFAEAETVKHAAKKTVEEMAVKGGAGLLAGQIRTLADRAARRALEKKGEKSLDSMAFKALFEQLGKLFSEKAAGRVVPVVSAAVGGLFDLSQMNGVISYADVFYNKRFLVEKEERIRRLLSAT